MNAIGHGATHTTSALESAKRADCPCCADHRKATDVAIEDAAEWRDRACRYGEQRDLARLAAVRLLERNEALLQHVAHLESVVERLQAWGDEARGEAA